MAIETTCGGCGKLLSVGDENAGRRARCPACGQIYTIPGPQGLAPDSSQSSAPPDLPATQDFGSQPLNDALAQTTAGTSSSQPIDSNNSDQFWMRSMEGAEYGPVDRANLNRWFNEGRVGPGYMIRQSESGMWQSADIFKPGAMPAGNIAGSPMASLPASGTTFTSNSGNPYAANTANPYTAPAGGFTQMYPKGDQSGLVLAFGILSWFLCPIFGIVAWVMGNTGLKDIQMGLVDPSNKGLMQAGYYLGMVHIILCTVFCGGYIVFIAAMIGLGAMR